MVAAVHVKNSHTLYAKLNPFALCTAEVIISGKTDEPILSMADFSLYDC